VDRLASMPGCGTLALAVDYQILTSLASGVLVVDRPR
jgi:hypothetical protein